MMGTALMFAAVVASAPVSQQQITQAEVDQFVWQVKSCWSILPEDINSGVIVTVLVDLARDGSVTGTEMGGSLQSAAEQRLARSAVRAVERCAPYVFSVETYEEWKHLKLELRP